VVRFRRERSFDRSYRCKKVGTDGNPFQDSKTYHYDYLKNKKMKNEPVIIERTFNASVDKVWKAITDKDQMKQWYFDTIDDFKPEVGFQTQFKVRNGNKDYLHIWKVTEVETGKRISYEWKFGGYPGNSLVTFELVAFGKKTKLKLTHQGIETFLPDRNPTLARENFVEGWTSLIGRFLKDFIEK
jgi:uncharacterized protein YndB with AHSA1/START domain